MSAKKYNYLNMPDGEEVGVVFSNMALAKAEQQLGKGIFAVSQGFQDGSTGLTETAVILQVGMEAYRRDQRVKGKPVSLKQAYDIMDEVGFAEVADVVFSAVAGVLGYSSDDPEESDEDEEGDTDPNA